MWIQVHKVSGGAHSGVDVWEVWGAEGPSECDLDRATLTHFVALPSRSQEMADEVPEGATPRTLSVHLRGDVCRSMKVIVMCLFVMRVSRSVHLEICLCCACAVLVSRARCTMQTETKSPTHQWSRMQSGDVIVLSGVFLPEPVQGFKAMRAGLLTTTYIQAMDVEQTKTSYSAHVLTDAQADQLARLAEEGDVYGRLAGSIAPEIFGMEDVKKVWKCGVRREWGGEGAVRMARAHASPPLRTHAVQTHPCRRCF
jgi:hypothetical protein